MKIEYKKGSRIKAPVEVTYAAIEKARDESGVNVALLVHNAKPKSAPLHGEFEWNNAKAGQKYREQQGRSIIRSVMVVREDALTTREFVSVPVVVQPATSGEKPKTQKQYHSVGEVMADEGKRYALLKQALGELESFRHKYSVLLEWAGVSQALKGVIESAKRQHLSGSAILPGDKPKRRNSYL